MDQKRSSPEYDGERMGESATPPPTAPLLVPEPEARRLLGGISRRKLALMVAAGEVPSTKIGTRRMFPIDGLRAYVAARTEGGR